MKADVQYFSVVLFIMLYKAALTLKAVDKLLIFPCMVVFVSLYLANIFKYLSKILFFNWVFYLKMRFCRG